MTKYDKALERASTLQYRHIWLNWKAMGWMTSIIIVAMVLPLWNIVVNNNSNSWGMLIGLGSGLLIIGGLALLDFVEHRHMSSIFGRIRVAAAHMQAEQAKKEGGLH